MSALALLNLASLTRLSGIQQGESAVNSSLSCFSLYFSCLSYFRVFVIRFELFSVLSVPLW